MDKELTEILVVLDRSSSMAAVASATTESYDSFVQEQKDANVGRCLLTLTQFNTEYEIVYQGKPIEDVPRLDFQPAGMTALRDAIGRTINEAGQRFAAMPEDKRPGNVVMMILTDGEENSSKEFTQEQVEALVKQQADKYDWTFIFLGQNIDAFHTGHSLGLDNSNANMFVGNVGDGGTGQRHAYQMASRAVSGTRSKVARGQSKGFLSLERVAYTNALGGDDSGLDDLDSADVDSSTSDSSGA